MPSIDLGNVMGPQGPQGTIWYQGTAITGTSTTAAVFADSGITEARMYDKYFNTATNDVYSCVTPGNAENAEWIWIGNLRGGTGPIGPVGPTGSVDMNTTIEFTEAETMANIESGESVSTIFGKLRKVVGNLLAGAASTLLGVKLTANRVLLSDANGNVWVSTITSTEIGYLDGVTKNIQEQFNEQNVKMGQVIHSSVVTSYGALHFIKNGKVQSVYGILQNLPTNATVELKGIIDAIPMNYAIANVFETGIPYSQIGTAWLYTNGDISINKPISITSCYIYGTYIIA